MNTKRPDVFCCICSKKETFYDEISVDLSKEEELSGEDAMQKIKEESEKLKSEAFEREMVIEGNDIFFAYLCSPECAFAFTTTVFPNLKNLTYYSEIEQNEHDFSVAL